MKNSLKRITAAVLLLACMVFLAPALAGTSTENKGTAVQSSGSPGLEQRLNALHPFKFEKHKKGIGYGKCPVYTAPSASSYRCADGRAAVQTNDAMDDAGYVSGWLMVRYETSNGNYRVGYIPPKYVKGYKSKMAPHFDYIPATADDTIYVTDNPMSHIGSFAMLEPGETFYILSYYNYYAKNGLDWWYIECEVDGQVARGFIDRSLSAFHLGSAGE